MSTSKSDSYLSTGADKVGKFNFLSAMASLLLKFEIFAKFELDLG